jgi:putative membrane protein
MDSIPDENESLQCRLARERTDQASERTQLANERTFSAWIRTGLAAVVAGLGIARLLDVGPSGWIASLIGLILILSGGAFYTVAFWSFYQDRDRLKQVGMKVMPGWLLTIILLALIASTVLALLLVFV